MKDAKKIFTFLFLSIAVVLTGCPEPVGSILYSVDYIKAVPNRFVYGQNDFFKPVNDVKVIGVFGGVEETISIDNVGIIIIEDPGLNTENPITVTNNQNGIRLENEGPKRVVISYNSYEARYDIAVGKPGMGDPGWGDNPNERETGIIIIWQ